MRILEKVLGSSTITLHDGRSEELKAAPAKIEAFTKSLHFVSAATHLIDSLNQLQTEVPLCANWNCYDGGRRSRRLGRCGMWRTSWTPSTRSGAA